MSLDSQFKDYCENSSSRIKIRRSFNFDRTYSERKNIDYHSVNSYEKEQQHSTGITGVEFEDRIALLRSPEITLDVVTYPDIKFENLKTISKLGDKTPSFSENIQNDLLEYSSKFRVIRNKEEKIKLLVNLNNFLKKNMEIIKNNFPDALANILNSL